MHLECIDFTVLGGGDCNQEQQREEEESRRERGREAESGGRMGGSTTQRSLLHTSALHIQLFSSTSHLHRRLKESRDSTRYGESLLERSLRIALRSLLLSGVVAINLNQRPGGMTADRLGQTQELGHSH
ncbi:hypothetical protein EYF80_048798 [Liparis tanakae]|uniref:Uncharacterized protein n=1 Tax=Liparis tanakae TaxID=230148 RepID=A0A4Z2FIN9_9TELE|nr:hypothetical protein EYF80_048798 [Liparis tanakae]